MTSFSPNELNKLVEDGISTVNFIQQNKEDIQKTYGRSAIDKPSTKDRTKAWETFTEGTSGGPVSQSGGVGGSKGDKKENSRGGPGTDRSPRIKGDGSDSSKDSKGTGDDNEAGHAKDPIKPGQGNRSDTGSEQAKHTAVRSPDQSGDGKSGRDDTGIKVNTEELSQILHFDEETRKVEEDEGHKSTMQIRDATPGDLGSILEEDSSKVHKRLRGITNMTMQDMGNDGPKKPVKKGTDENIASTPSMGKSLSGSGAIQHAPRSAPPRSKKNASAENAQSFVPTVSKTGCIEEGTQTSSDSGQIEKKIDLILAHLSNIDKKLTMIPEIKEDIKNLTKRMNTLALGLSTVEGYIKDMMIIIPKSGKTQEETQQEKNPTLRPVVGRDKTRGFTEVTTQKSNLERMDEGQEPKFFFEDRYMMYDLDFLKSNAANFVPENNKYTKRIMSDIINIHIKNKKLADRIRRWAWTQLEGEDPGTVYQALIESLIDLKDAPINKSADD
ncbi:P protein [Mount Mabu Lophuromys virus 2]|uniref:Phosphoprotein n=1 Tax=Mount Mabu Lophuromys virus 2 TaxID=2116560 RepID=A0A2P1GJ87_9MONO|nr:P protein [Mount Mabu Lophuromys virus 2]AVM86021.1 P protein [Mount Mabu Lophuromys virus 2]